MPPAIRNTFESAVVSLVVAGGLLWLLISTAMSSAPSPARVVLLSLALAVAVIIHVVFSLQLVRRTGRPFVPWCIAVVLVAPIGSALLLALLMAEQDGSEGKA